MHLYRFSGVFGVALVRYSVLFARVCCCMCYLCAYLLAFMLVCLVACLLCVCAHVGYLYSALVSVGLCLWVSLWPFGCVCIVYVLCMNISCIAVALYRALTPRRVHFVRGRSRFWQTGLVSTARGDSSQCGLSHV